MLRQSRLDALHEEAINTPGGPAGQFAVITGDHIPSDHWSRNIGCNVGMAEQFMEREGASQRTLGNTAIYLYSQGFGGTFEQIGLETAPSPGSSGTFIDSLAKNEDGGFHYPLLAVNVDNFQPGDLSDLNFAARHELKHALQSKGRALYNVPGVTGVARTAIFGAASAALYQAYNLATGGAETLTNLSNSNEMLAAAGIGAAFLTAGFTPKADLKRVIYDLSLREFSANQAAKRHNDLNVFYQK